MSQKIYLVTLTKDEGKHLQDIMNREDNRAVRRP
jgi:hypothetical protein